jgi:hypothetical protein
VRAARDLIGTSDLRLNLTVSIAAVAPNLERAYSLSMRFRVLFLLALLQGSPAWLEGAPETVQLASPGLSEWELITPEHAALNERVDLRPDGVLSLRGTPTGYLQTRARFENFHLSFEWRWPGQPGNSGVLLHIDSAPLDRNLWPRSLQVQLKHSHAGDLLPMAGATFREPLSTLPNAKTPQRDHVSPDSERPVGEWNVCEITCDHGSIEVTLNGVRQNQVTHCSPSAGRIGFQFEGTAYELRHITLNVLH